ncbi:MAG: sigma-54 interaction domain-containing protein [Calditrichia bacterium]
MPEQNSTDILKTLQAVQQSGIEQLRRENGYLKKLLLVSRQLSTLDLMQSLQLIIDNIVEITQAQRGFLMLLDKDNKLEIKVSNPPAEPLQNTADFAICQSISEQVARSGKGQLIEDIAHDTDFRNRKSVVELQLKAIMCVPLMVRDECLGILYVDSDRDKHRFSSSDLELFEAFASQAAVALENARLFEELKKEHLILQQEVRGLYQFDGLIYKSPAMQRVAQNISRVLDNDITVLIQGETGTGKEVIARTIHFNCLRKEKRFVAQNCGALSDNLLESELFGHKKGAFTGAVEDKIGLFEAANDGTIFLDEISETSSALQLRLLRVLEDGMIRRVGDTKDRKVNIRVLAASNRDLLEQVEAGNFREDLYYRLNVFPITLPPLRERREDITALVQFFIKEFNEELKKDVSSISSSALHELTQRNWKGNIRQLRNHIYRLMVLTRGTQLSTDEEILNPVTEQGLGTRSAATLDEVERSHILRVLQQVNKNKTKAAEILGVKRTTLLARMKKLKISSDSSI